MKSRYFLLLLLCMATLLTTTSCKNRKAADQNTEEVAQDGNTGGTEPTGPAEIPARLVSKFSNGEISECTLKGKKVFHCRLNANDAGSEIYGLQAEKIATCNSAWGQKPEPECAQLEDCKVFYRVKDNIWGLPPVTGQE